jgi:hypothetical protein
MAVIIRFKAKEVRLEYDYRLCKVKSQATTEHHTSVNERQNKNNNELR